MLPENKDKPPRPDVPILRHLTYDELHSWVLGIVGLPIGVAITGGESEMAVVFTVTIFAFVLGIKALPTRNGAPKALEAMASEPWYFTSAYVVWFTLGLLVGAWLTRVIFPPVV